MKKYLLSLFLLLSISSCHLGPKYRYPQTDAPQGWKAEMPQEGYALTVDNWWEVFKDDELSFLECEAIANSPTLYLACERVAEARAITASTASALYPQATINPSYNDSAQLFKLFLPPGTTVPIPSPIFRVHQFEYILPLNMSYEIDIWGKTRGLTDSAMLSFEAQLAAYSSTLLTLTSNVATNYFLIRSLDSQIELYEGIIQLQKSNFELIQTRYSKGLSTKLDVAVAEEALANTESSYNDTLRQRALLENALATLLGKPASDFTLHKNPLTELPPQIPPGVPADILLKRPDIAQAERLNASEHALIGVAYASYFPSLTLTGSLGYLSPDFTQFLKWISRYWALGASSNQVLFDGGHTSAEVAIAWARYREASATYRQQVLVAFQEVEDSLNSLNFQRNQYESLLQAESASATRSFLTRERYQKGLDNALQDIDARNANLNASLNRTYLLGQRYLSTIQLIKALGGRWECGE